MNTFPFDPSKQVYEQGISSITYYGQADLGTAVDDPKWSIFSVESTGGDVIQRWACGPNGMPTSSPIFAFSEVQSIDFSLIQIDPNEVGDTDPPTVENAYRHTNISFTLEFNEAIDAGSIMEGTPNGFTLYGDDVQKTITSCSIDEEDPKKLNFITENILGGNTVIVNYEGAGEGANIADTNGNLLEAVSNINVAYI